MFDAQKYYSSVWKDASELTYNNGYLHGVVAACLHLADPIMGNIKDIEYEVRNQMLRGTKKDLEQTAIGRELLNEAKEMGQLFLFDGGEEQPPAIPTGPWSFPPILRDWPITLFIKISL
jgi:hypothetical protein